MSRENVELVLAVYEAVNRGDLETADLYIHPEIELHTYVHSPEAGVYRGKEAVQRYNKTLFEQFESLRIVLEELIDAGDRVIVVSTQHAVPKGGQQEMEVHMAEVWTVRDLLLAERHSYASEDEALAAVGLEE
jgi:ketosteroid isomerase-like protein